MKRAVIIAASLVVIVGAFLAGSWYNQRASVSNSVLGARKVLYYMDPMHPAYKSDKPGIAPDCGMELVPVYENGSMGRPGEGPGGSTPGTIAVSPDRQQMIGMRVGQVKKAAGSRTLRLVGRVAPDETRIYRINASVDGWIRKTFANTTGSLVKKDETLATFYSPEFLGAEQAYIFALSSLDRFHASGKESPDQIALAKTTLKQYLEALRNLGMGEPQLEEIARTRQYDENILMSAPVTGFVLTRNVSPGERFSKSAELYKIADLGRVWILVDVFENEVEYLPAGRIVQAFLPARGKAFHARVSQVPPVFDGVTRTLKVRLEADNPGFVLRPDMFMDVEVPVTFSSTMVVPVDAVVDSGTKKTVYVAKGDGVFELRKVETGWRAGDQMEIVSGLMPGETIVVAGTFLLDSESRMKLAAAGIYGATSKDPVCGLDVDEGRAKAAGLTSRRQGMTYYFCSIADKQEFDKNPTRYVKKAAHTGDEHAAPMQAEARP